MSRAGRYFYYGLGAPALRLTGRFDGGHTLTLPQFLEIDAAIEAWLADAVKSNGS